MSEANKITSQIVTQFAKMPYRSYMQILAKILQFVKTHIDAILLLLIIMLFVLVSFASGYIIAKYQDRAPILINQDSAIH